MLETVRPIFEISHGSADALYVAPSGLDEYPLTIGLKDFQSDVWVHLTIDEARAVAAQIEAVLALA